MKSVSSPSTTRLLLLAVICVFCVLVGFILPSSMEKGSYFMKMGLYFILAAFLLWGVAASRLLQGENSPGALVKRHWQPLLFSLGLVVLVFVVSPPKFRILSDETLLISTSLGMFKLHMPVVIWEAVSTPFDFSALSVDNAHRPLVFPFLMYVVHAIVGFSPYNGFAVNFLAGWAVLFLVHLLARRWFSNPLALLAPIGLAASPLFVLLTTSSGFDVTCLAFMVLAFAVFDQHVREPSPELFEFLLITLVILAQCRYESPIFLLVMAPIALLIVGREGIPRLGLPTLAAPILLLPIPWQRLSENMQASFNSTASVEVFSLQHLLDHFQPAAHILSGLARGSGIIPIISLLAALGLATLLLGARNKPSRSWLLLGLAAGLSLGLMLLVQLAYYDGDFSKSVNTRYALMFLPAMSLLALVPIAWLLQRSRAALAWAMAAFLFLPVWYWPQASADAYIGSIEVPKNYNYTLNYLLEHHPPYFSLVVGLMCHGYIGHGYSGIRTETAVRNLQSIKRDFDASFFKTILLIEEIDKITRRPEDETPLSDFVETEVLLEYPYNDTTIHRVSRVTAIPGEE